jgi:hypothetical protein
MNEIIKLLTDKNVTADTITQVKANIAALSPENKSALRSSLAKLGFFSKGSAWNLGIFADIGDIFRPNTGANNTLVSIGNVALKGTGLATGGVLAYKGVRYLFEGGASMGSAATATLAAAATLDGACCGG